MQARMLALVLAAGLGFGCSKSSTDNAKLMEPAKAAEPAAPTAGFTQAPAGQLTQTDNAQVAIADVLHKHAETVVVFYRGFY